jgi:hypothetical protein
MISTMVQASFVWLWQNPRMSDMKLLIATPGKEILGLESAIESITGTQLLKLVICREPYQAVEAEQIRGIS